MYTVYLVDDEQLIREGLKRLLDWAALGYEIIGDTGSPGEALKQVAALLPDLVITDVKMPGMSGIELIQRLQAEGYEGAFLIISGYSDFEYARSAIRFGVKSYLLKPLDERELAGELFALRKVLAERPKQREKRQPDPALTVEKQWEHYLSGLAPQGGLTLPEGLSGTELCIVLFQLPPPRQEASIPYPEQVGALLKGRRIQRLYASAREIAFLSAEDYADTVQLIRRLLDVLRAGGNLGVLASLGSGARGLEELPASYQYARSGMERSFLYRKDGLVERHPDAEQSPAEKIAPEEMCSELLKGVQYQSPEMIRRLLKRWKDGFIGSGSDELEIKMAYTGLYTAFALRVASIYKELPAAVFRRQEMIGDAYIADSVEQLNRICEKYLGGISEALSGILPESAMEKAIGFLQTNYMDKISLESVSHMLHYNHSYFGRKFRQYTGEYFGAYLDRLRVEKSKPLIEEGYKIYQVAEMVGFSNVDYFNIKFKRYAGMSPTAYRSRGGGKEDPNG